MKKIRSFVSIEVPLTNDIMNIQEKLRYISGVSVQDSIHLTLRFLGDVDEKKIRRLSEYMKDLEKNEPFTISLKGVGAFPNIKDPRVIWIGANFEGRFDNILSELDALLIRSSINYDNKPFKAHVTLGRVKKNSDLLTSVIKENSETVFDPFVCSEILLMNSVLTPCGAKHSVIERFGLSKLC